MERVREEKRREEKRREEKRREEERGSEEETVRRRRSKCAKMQESRDSLCFSNGLWLRSAKAAGAEPSGQMRDEKLHDVVARSTFPSETFRTLLEVEMSKKCTPLWREAHFQVEMYKILQCRSTFGS